MGAYVNPPKEEKEQFLEREGVPITREQAAKHRRAEDPDRLVVALVNNGPYTAAAIGYSDQETAVFVQESRRPVAFFLVPLKKLLEVSLDLPHYLGS